MRKLLAYTILVMLFSFVGAAFGVERPTPDAHGCVALANVEHYNVERGWRTVHVDKAAQVVILTALGIAGAPFEVAIGLYDGAHDTVHSADERAQLAGQAVIVFSQHGCFVGAKQVDRKALQTILEQHSA